MARILALIGPTAVGKTACIGALADEFAAVIYADTACLYKDLNIGAAKPSAAERRRLPHYMIDVLDLEQSFDVGDFFRTAEEVCARYDCCEKPLLLSGGTFFYLYNFLFGLSSAPRPKTDTREYWQERLRREGSAALHKILSTADPVSAQRLSPNDGFRVTRALEVFHDTGKPLSSFPRPNSLRKEHDWLIITLVRPREELYARINARVEDMWQRGLPEEVEHLKKNKNVQADWPSMKAIGYRQFFMNLPSPEVVKEQICLDSRHYAKRQITFLKQIPAHHFCDADDTGLILNLVKDWKSNRPDHKKL